MNTTPTLVDKDGNELRSTQSIQEERMRMAAERLSAIMNEDREKWLAKHMKKLVPNHIRCAARSKDPNKRAEAAGYLAEHKIRLKYRRETLSCELWEGETCIATWTPQIKLPPKPETPTIIKPETSIIAA